MFMSDRICIRHATAPDAEGIAALLGELGYPSTAGEVVARLSRLDDFHSAVVFIAEIDGIVAGVVTGHVFPAIHVSEVVAWLTTLAVGSGYQRRGVGRYLATAVEDWARSRGAFRISVTSGTHRDGAHAFYERLGYERSGVRLSKRLIDLAPPHTV
jgi:GNAT superfamily N-acetyltransferase